MPKRTTAATALREITLPGATIALRNVDWFTTLTPGLKLAAGAVAPSVLRVPVRDAELVLRRLIHLVADIRADSPPTVVWVLGKDELLVLLDKTALACGPGLVTISLFVSCDELRGIKRVDVPFAVGSPTRPSGLIMSTFDRVAAPAEIADTWSRPIIAFAWEALVTVATQLAAGVGRDSAKRPLVPATIAADRSVLLIGAMARNALTSLPTP
jgi:hypothetical protein